MYPYSSAASCAGPSRCIAASRAENASPWHHSTPAAWKKGFSAEPLYQTTGAPRSRAENSRSQYSLVILPAIRVLARRLDAGAAMVDISFSP